MQEHGKNLRYDPVGREWHSYGNEMKHAPLRDLAGLPVSFYFGMVCWVHGLMLLSPTVIGL